MGAAGMIGLLYGMTVMLQVPPAPAYATVRFHPPRRPRRAWKRRRRGGHQ